MEFLLGTNFYLCLNIIHSQRFWKRDNMVKGQAEQKTYI